MLIPVYQLRVCWDVSPIGVLHVGAHEAEEAVAYEKAGWTPVIWVEGLPEKADALRNRFKGSAKHSVVSAIAWDEDGLMLPMHRASNGQSSSVFEMSLHLIEHPTISVVDTCVLPSSRLDTALGGCPHPFDFLSLDIQGAELHALKGLGSLLDGIRWVYAEVNTKALYRDAPLVKEIDAYLAGFQFTRVDTAMTSHGWGDALYIRNDVLPRSPAIRRFARRLIARVLRTDLAAKLFRDSR